MEQNKVPGSWPCDSHSHCSVSSAPGAASTVGSNENCGLTHVRGTETDDDLLAASQSSGRSKCFLLKTPDGVYKRSEDDYDMVEQSEADGAASEEAAAGYCVVGTGDNGTDWDPNSQIAASHLQSMGELMMRGASAVRRHLP